MSTKIGDELLEQLRPGFGKWLRISSLILAASLGMTVITHGDSPLLRVESDGRGVIALCGCLSLIGVVFTAKAGDHNKNLLHDEKGEQVCK